MIHNWSAQFSNYIGRELGLEKQKIVLVSYGTEVLIGGLIKLIFFILVPLLFGVFKQFLAAYISFALVRLPSGGVHCSAFYRCLTISLTTYMTIAFLARYLANSDIKPLGVLWIVSVIAFLSLVRLAPVDVKEKPIRCTRRRKRLKLLSCISVIVLLTVVSYWNPEPSIVWACAFGLLFQVFTLTRAGKGLFKWVDKVV